MVRGVDLIAMQVQRSSAEAAENTTLKMQIGLLASDFKRKRRAFDRCPRRAFFYSGEPGYVPCHKCQRTQFIEPVPTLTIPTTIKKED